MSDTDESIRQGIMDDLLAAVFSIDEVKGCVDDLPPANLADAPPQPRPGFGEPRFPFGYVVDGNEGPIGDATTAQYECKLPIEIAIVYRYSKTDGNEGCKRKGRRLLAKLQAAIMLDPNRGTMIEPQDNTERKRAQDTLETDNEVGEGVAEELIGLAVWRGTVDYNRSRKDPTSAQST